jgi:hypothetical protein
MKKTTKSTKKPSLALKRSPLGVANAHLTRKATGDYGILAHEVVRLNRCFWQLYPFSACHTCHLIFGAKVPKGPNCNTVTNGQCPICGEDNKTLCPTSDYIWPNSPYIWD